jgi:DNA-binding MarR family transcriptional regulator
MDAVNSTPRSTRRSPTSNELAVWRAFVEVGDELRSTMTARLQTESGISSGDYTVLLALSEAPNGQLRSSDLASHVGWERSRLSHHLGRMERRGLVRRDDCATDNRGAEVILTAAGADAFRHANVPHLHAIRELFVDALTPEQLVAMGEIAESLRGHSAP